MSDDMGVIPAVECPTCHSPFRDARWYVGGKGERVCSSLWHDSDDLTDVTAERDALAAKVAAVSKLADEWEAASLVAQHTCAYCGEGIVKVEPFRLYPHMADMIGHHIHEDGGSFCDGSPDSGRAHPDTYQPKGVLNDLRTALDVS